MTALSTLGSPQTYRGIADTSQEENILSDTYIAWNNGIMSSLCIKIIVNIKAMIDCISAYISA